MSRIPKFLCLILFALATFLSCSKDDEEMNDLSLVKATASTGLKAYAKAPKIEGSAPLKINFSGSSSKDKTQIASWRWTFGDGNRSGWKNPIHTFTKAGTYKVVLTIKDKSGASASSSLTIVVGGGTSGLKAYAKASKIEGSAPLKINFSGSSSKDKTQIASWRWTFGDGNRSGWKNPIYTFTKAGTYKVVLTIKDKSGASASSSLTIVVGGGSESGLSIKKSGTYPSNAVFASSYGYNKSDATNALEAALKSGKSYVVVDKQSSDWIIRPLSLFDLKDMTIVFEPGVTLRAKSGAFKKTNDQLFQLLRAQNITIEGYGATFKMNKSEYTSGEHRHALALSKCTGITVRGLTLRDSGGDGILIAGMGSGTYSQNITIEDVVSTNNRRLGMGIISAQDVWVRNSEFSNTNGTLPEAGVDLEPNTSSERLVNINFANCKFSNNASRGFFLSTGKMTSSSTPISVKVTNSDFSYNASSSGAKRPVAEIELSAGIIKNPVRGEIVFEGMRFNGSNNNILFSKKSAEAYSAVFKNCTAKDVTKNSETAISLQALSTVNTLGGFVFDNFTIEYSKDVPFMSIGAPSSGFTVKNIRGDFTIKEPNNNPMEYLWGYKKSKNSNVSIAYDHI